MLGQGKCAGLTVMAASPGALCLSIAHVREGRPILNGLLPPAAEGEEDKLVKDGSWAKLLAKVFGVDVSSCVFCGALLRIIGPVVDAVSVARYLRHIGLSDRPPARAPPPPRQRSLNFSYEPC